MNELIPTPEKKKVFLTYFNHRGITKNYLIQPIRFYYGSTRYYPDECYLVEANVFAESESPAVKIDDLTDVEPALKTFSLASVMAWKEV